MQHLIVSLLALAPVLAAAGPSDLRRQASDQLELQEAEVIHDTGDYSFETKERPQRVEPDSEHQTQIVGGYTAQAGEFPSIISLQDSSGHFCGGTLLDPTTVLTAAHCVEQGGRLSVRAGSTSTTSGGITAGVNQIIIHSGWGRGFNQYDNDFAILKLARSIGQTNGISYAPLPPYGSDPADRTPSIVAGWGALYENGPGPSSLQAVEVPIVAPDICNDLYSGQGGITDNMICAGWANGGQDACQGDSGGPLYDLGNGELIGVVSFGEGCARPNYPGVYSRVGVAIPFIERYLG